MTSQREDALNLMPQVEIRCLGFNVTERCFGCDVTGREREREREREKRWFAFGTDVTERRWFAFGTDVKQRRYFGSDVTHKICQWKFGTQSEYNNK